MKTDVWRNLAAAIVHRAIDDARGCYLFDYGEVGRAKVIAEAQSWLLGEAGTALLTALDLDCDVVLDALTHPTAHKARRESPRIPQPRRRRRTA